MASFRFLPSSLLSPFHEATFQVPLCTLYLVAVSGHGTVAKMQSAQLECWLCFLSSPFFSRVPISNHPRLKCGPFPTFVMDTIS